MDKLSLVKYQKFVKKSLEYKKPNNNILVFGMNGELGSIYSCIKKKMRDKIINKFSMKEMEEELGDLLWYITAICCRFNFKLDEILIENLKRIKNNPKIIYEDNPKLKNTNSSKLKNMIIPINFNYFSQYQSIVQDSIIGVKLRKSHLFLKFCYPLTKIGHDIYEGFYFNNFNNNIGQKNLENRNKLKNRLGDLCWYLSVIADYYDISMDEVIRKNKDKVSGIFGKKIVDLKKNFFDKNFKHPEQLPRKFTVYFHNKDSDISYIVINKIEIGDPLDDNIKKNDGYRYHDGIHFTIYALLGWSPVWRGFLHKKRKSKSKIDRAEDGARAKIVEEMIVKIIHSYFEELGEIPPKKNSVNFEFLKNISILTKGLEIEKITYSQWEEVIFKSKEIYNLLKHNNGGKLYIDLENRKIKYRKLTDKERENPFGKRENTFEN